LLVLVVGRNGAPDELAVVNQAMDKVALDAWTKTHIVPKDLLDAENDAVPGRAGPATRDSSAPGGLLGPRNPSGSRSTAPARPQGVGR
jgi:hypothetical protein